MLIAATGLTVILFALYQASQPGSVPLDKPTAGQGSALKQGFEQAPPPNACVANLFWNGQESQALAEMTACGASGVPAIRLPEFPEFPMGLSCMEALSDTQAPFHWMMCNGPTGPIPILVR
jgi:hypothetical protein